ncbi:MAG: trypsin-like peptidase domain-containing protein [Acidimicrobiia bacterium]|nr:trypsin-like peptidase domain-containing protein [Acidimicrobiia bacterium]
MRLVAAALALALLPSASGAPRPPEESTARVLRLVKPALVRIETHATATVSAATIGFDQGALEGFARRDVDRLLASGQRYPTLAAAQQVITSDLEHEFVANPAPYLQLRDRVSNPYDSARVGSGWLVNGDGPVVTASDVLLDEPAVTADATEQARQDVTADLDDLTPADLGLTVPFSDAQKANLVDAALARVVPTIQVSNISSHTIVQLGSVVPAHPGDPDAPPDARIAIDHSSPHGMGVAVLQIQTRGQQLASVPLGFGSALSPGAPVVVAGYQAAEAQSGGPDSSTPVAPDAVDGTINDAVPEGGALTSAGYTDGVIGGPVLDADGQAIGVAVKRDGGPSAIAPIGDVIRALDDSHTPASTNAVTKDYRKAAADMSQNWFKRALPIFRSISERAPSMPWVDDQIQEAGQQIAVGNDESPSDRPFFPVALAAVLFATDAIAVTTVLRRRFLHSEGG